MHSTDIITKLSKTPIKFLLYTCWIHVTWGVTTDNKSYNSQYTNIKIWYKLFTFYNIIKQLLSWTNIRCNKGFHQLLKGSDKFRNFLFLIDPNTLLELINTHKSLIWSLFNLLLINKWHFLKIVGTHFWTLILHVHFYLYNLVIKSDI